MPNQMHAKESQTSNLHPSTASENTGPRKSKTSFTRAIVLLGLIITAILAAWMLDWFPITDSQSKHREHEYMGAVQKITYVGNLGPDTQIDTENRTFLLRGAASLKKGDRMERRETFFTIKVCELETGRCWDLMDR